MRRIVIQHSRRVDLRIARAVEDRIARGIQLVDRRRAVICNQHRCRSRWILHPAGEIKTRIEEEALLALIHVVLCAEDKRIETGHSCGNHDDPGGIQAQELAVAGCIQVEELLIGWEAVVRGLRRAIAEADFQRSVIGERVAQINLEQAQAAFR